LAHRSQEEEEEQDDDDEERRRSKPLHKSPHWAFRKRLCVFFFYLFFLLFRYEKKQAMFYI
jgi:hypothetical protein